MDESNLYWNGYMGHPVGRQWERWAAYLMGHTDGYGDRSRGVNLDFESADYAGPPPPEYTFTGEFRPPRIGEYFMCDAGHVMTPRDNIGWPPRHILELDNDVDS